ncbi:3-methyladenine DNA glycosylase AlkD [Algoriphagus sp. 4150]|uniref:DNA alkylation repair protein n=1 Tax=Algoriphagus sp. 4150 TaxID=2817756 RepID=UPI0028612227|nr:DNA alkylation repair protein [Algoriphagus sp. 4150]MDR7130808.1 3-methyladenine DNA glycosylase AlkD [Algoriphagus sp. 4150]
MTVQEVLSQLESLGNEKMIALHRKNGATQALFGVKMGDLRTVAKKIKTNHELGLALWKTRNIDAQLLAILIIKPTSLSNEELDKMVTSLDFPQLADWFNAYILKDHPEKETLRKKWLESGNKWALRAVWSLTAGRVTRSPEGLNLGEILDYLESHMPIAAPEVQWTMNTALAQIGINHPNFRARAIEIGEKLGVYRDYPVSKGCTSPFAPLWIKEMVSRQ